MIWFHQIKETENVECMISKMELFLDPLMKLNFKICDIVLQNNTNMNINILLSIY